ncbi:MAG: hypothetical protein HY943_10370 [Gammaproteobacteria bacterium]|nr:hypothetical protein [Gammaproteobacteria bacterium]
MVSSSTSQRRRIRALRLVPAPVLIMVTAYGKDVLLTRASDAGIQDVFPKPVTASTLFDAVISVLGGVDGQRLPALAAPQDDHPADLARIAGARILLVEDNPLSQKVGAALLEDAGLKVEIAENGAVALQKIPAGHYDLVPTQRSSARCAPVCATCSGRRISRPSNSGARTGPSCAHTSASISGRSTRRYGITSSTSRSARSTTSLRRRRPRPGATRPPAT